MVQEKQDEMHLNAFLMASGHHEAGWRLEGADPKGVTDMGHWLRLAEIAESGKFDSVFIADAVYVGWDVKHMASLAAVEPILVLAAMAARTAHIGLIGTTSTSFNEPYNLARRFATLDHLSGGRAAWNCITSVTDAEARNFGMEDLPLHAKRYERASEFVEVVNKLWDSWEDSAYLGDAESGIWADVEKIHPVNHKGEHFSVAGALSTPRSPQGRPVIFQAGSSEAGMDLAARVSDAVFTAQTTFERAVAFRGRMRELVHEKGRSPDEVLVLPGFMPIVGSTEAEAKEVESQLMEATSEDQLLNYVSQTFEHQFTADDLDKPLDESVPSDTKGHKERPKLLREMAAKDGLNLRELAQRAVFARGHAIKVGTPEQIADEMERWFRGGAADGFNIMPPMLPLGLEVFVDQVVPVLQERGLFRREYQGETLRDNLGLTRPDSQYVGTRA